ncbi:MAG: dUTP diphosphatase [Parachlamydiaceae bacterium]|nr:dUTP diphosphatase [Parachlamydiaceae bacterium]
MCDEKNVVEISLCVDSQDFLPIYASTLAAGADIKACIKEDLIIPPGSSTLVPTGVKAAIPQGFEIQVRPRSGLALKDQVTVLNSPGTIDADYRGEIKVILINHGKKDFVVKRGMRIAQIVVAPVCQALFVSVSELASTERGDNGFGHTGVH